VGNRFMQAQLKTEYITRLDFMEYLDLELITEERHEYHQGELFLMSGASINHNYLTGQLYILLTDCARKQKFSRVFMSDIKLRIETFDKSVYPDIMIFLDPIEYANKNYGVVSNPNLIVEVLSSSTADYDHGDKFRAYRSLANFQEYLLVDQYRPRVEHFVKIAPHEWIFHEYEGMDERFNLHCLDCVVTLSNLYQNVEF